MDRPRSTLLAAATARGRTLKDLSLLIGRNPAYLQQYVRRRTPRQLGSTDRRNLAALLQVEADALGPVAIVEEVAAAVWESRRQVDDPAWAEAGAYWQERFTELASVAVATIARS